VIGVTSGRAIAGAAVCVVLVAVSPAAFGCVDHRDAARSTAAARSPALVRGAVLSAVGRLGALRIDKSTPADIRRFAGAPAFVGRGKTAANFAGFLPLYKALGYACSRRRSRGYGLDPGGARAAGVWCRIVYFVNPKTGRLAGFWTDSNEFRTRRGSRPGMRQALADRIEGARAHVGALTGIALSTRTARLFIENKGCKPGPNLNSSPCLGGIVRALILEGRHPVGLLEDGIPNA
jgi:hypothetical protein